ncbi:MAG: hypothetical protein QOC96_2438 [Acidobacteriota bacterium]|jgi:hypothetical protein|nr:hypothetical protein [Acidobacteriota bacterium]
MATNIQAIEVQGEIDEQNQLHLDEPLRAVKPGRVRVIILLAEESEMDDEREWLEAAANNPAFAFLHDTEEDIYTAADGKPFND